MTTEKQKLHSNRCRRSSIDHGRIDNRLSLIFDQINMREDNKEPESDAESNRMQLNCCRVTVTT